MRYKYYYYLIYNPKIIDVLEKYKIRYQVFEKTRITPSFIRFSFFSTSTNATEIACEIANISSYNPIITAEYTDSEMTNAEWLWITPKRQSIDISNVPEAYLATCTYTDSFGMRRVSHQCQRDLFMIEKEPVIGKQIAFWAESTGLAEIFVDSRVRDLIEENSLSGIELKKVLLKKGIYSSKVFQLTAQQVIDRQFIGTGYGEKIISCEFCGREQFVIEQAYQLHVDFSIIDKKSDMYVTDRIFGEGISYPLYIISQRFYQLLKRANLAGGITVSPVVDIGDREDGSVVSG